MMADAYLLNSRTFAFEAFDDEIVVLDIVQGTYFTIGGWVVDIWKPLVEGAPLAGIAAAVAGSYGRPIDALAAELASLAAQLVEARILVETEALIAAPVLAPAKGPSLPLAFERHSDMEELLTLDPIHGVDPEMGWPHYRPKD